MSDTTVVIADDHPLFRSALKQAVNQSFEQQDILEAENVDDLFQLISKNPQIELVFLDLHMPGNDGFTGLTQLQNHHPDIVVVMVSSDEEPDIMLKAIQFGAAAFIPKSADLQVISSAIEQVLDGEIWLPEGIDATSNSGQLSKHKELAEQLAQLTPQQFTVLKMIANGQLNKQIAYELDIKETTVKKHVSAILDKLNVTNRTMAGLAYQQLKLN
ncbi:MAG: response regulator transcription factor [Gammaproteobacteria bacterium]|nr:response regulator transcription factor [Gammaproteobacteria bacterium]